MAEEKIKMVLLMSGKQGSGKTTTSKYLADLLHGRGLAVKVFKFADPLYEMHQSIMDILAPYGYKPKVKWGKLLQYLGTEFGRDQLDQNIWLNIMKQKLKSWFEVIEWADDYSKAYVVIVDDMRFKNEWLENLREDYKILRIRLECPEQIRKERCENWRPDTTHASEIGLDDWLSKFDLVVHTDEAEIKARKSMELFLYEKLGLG